MPKDDPPRPDLRDAAEYSHQGTKRDEITVPSMPRGRVRTPPVWPQRPVPAPLPRADTMIGLGPTETPIPESRRPPRSMSPAPWERQSVVDRARTELERRGDHLVHPPESTRLPANPAPRSSLMAAAERVPILKILAIFAGACTGLAGLVTAIGSTAVNIIQAQRPASNAELLAKIEKVEQRQDGAGGIEIEAKARRAQIEELRAELAAVKAELKTLDTPRIHGIAPAPPPK